TPRAYHRATLLTDGTVLFAGGVSADGGVLRSAELWDPQAQTATAVPAELSVPRRNHSSQLLADGKVLLWVGMDGNGQLLSNGELYDPEAQNFIPIETLPFNAQATNEIPALVFSRPEDGTQNVPLQQIIVLGFS